METEPRRNYDASIVKCICVVSALSCGFHNKGHFGTLVFLLLPWTRYLVRLHAVSLFA